MKFERGYRRDEDVEIDVKVVSDGTTSILVHDGSTTASIPRSLIRNFDWDQDYEGQEVTITIPEWLAIEKGLV